MRQETRDTHDRPKTAVETTDTLLSDNLAHTVHHAVVSGHVALRVLDHFSPAVRYCRHKIQQGHLLDGLGGRDGDNRLHHTGAEASEHRPRGSEVAL